MIYGIALGYKSAIIPVLVLAIVVYGAFTLADMYGVSLAAIGFLSNLATGLTIDVYGPVCDNAGGKSYIIHLNGVLIIFWNGNLLMNSFCVPGIAEMAELDPYVREKTDALDAAGNTTAA
jgi:inorganic pyrophosphatase